MFEEHIQNFTGAQYAVAVINGTAALHMALLLAGVKMMRSLPSRSLFFQNMEVPFV
jgi:perosamine synthetase